MDLPSSPRNCGDCHVAGRDRRVAKKANAVAESCGDGGWSSSICGGGNGFRPGRESNNFAQAARRLLEGSDVKRSSAGVDCHFRHRGALLVEVELEYTKPRVIHNP